MATRGSSAVAVVPVTAAAYCRPRLARLMPEVSVVIPCLNEAETLGVCIDKARGAMERAGIDGEVVVADNGSVDGSPELAVRHGARVVPVAERGYGAALRAGIAA